MKIKNIVKTVTSPLTTPINDYRRVKAEEIAKRIEIQDNLVKDLAAIEIASAATKARIAAGQVKGLAAITTEFEFQTIVARNNM